MADGEGATHHVELVRVDDADGRLLPTLFPGLQVAQHLSRESLVYLHQVHIRQRQPGLAQHPRHRQAGAHEQAVLRADAHELEGLEKSQRLPLLLPRPLLGHQQHGGRTVRQGARVSCRQSAGGGTIKNGAQLGELLQRCGGANQRILRDTVQGMNLRR